MLTELDNDGIGLLKKYQETHELTMRLQSVCVVDFLRNSVTLKREP